MKARFSSFGEGFFLIHVENQGRPQEAFAGRMFCYFSRSHEKYRLPVFPVAIFSFDRPLRPEPDRYTIDFPGRRVLDFSFHAIQLNRLNWRDFLRNPNPVASALMTKMKIAPEDRPRVKLECLRMLATLKLDKARARLITIFMDSYLKLTTEENIVYNREIEAIEPKERELVMEYTNEWIEQGKAEGKRETLLGLLRRRFGIKSPDVVDRIERLSFAELGELADAFLDFQQTSDLERWLAERPAAV